MKKRTKITFSFILVVCLLLSILPGAAPVAAVEADEAFAAPITENAALEAPTASSENAAVTEDISSGDVSILYEDISLRKEYEKHFLMSDGSYQAVVYSQPVHELVDGTWVEIQSTNQNARGNVTTDTTKSNIIDNYVLQGGGVQNKSLDRLYIGNRSAGLTRAYIQFAAMPTIPEGSTITAATMTLHFTSGTSTAANASAYQVTEREWASGEIQWSNKPAAEVLLQSNISHNNVTGYTFSCLTAVRHWYDGDTTGQNENYGIMLRYYDETTDDYNAVYSADYTDAAKRPALTITYQAPTDGVSVLEGYTYALSVPDVTETITWASSDTSIATVSTGGVVTGVRAGKATITASTGSLVHRTFTVYVTIASGVYYIKQSGACLGTTGRVQENTSVSLYAQSTSASSQLSQLWKITYLSNGYYTIRPMYRLSMGLHATSNSVDITSISTTDMLSEIPLTSCWGIERSDDGVIFKHVNTSNMAMKANMPYPGASVSTTNYSSGSSGFHWTLEKVTDIYNRVILIDTDTGTVLSDAVRHLATGNTSSPDDYGLTASFVSAHTNEQIFTWSTSNTSAVSVDTTSGAVTGLQSGKRVTITVKTKNTYRGLYHSASYEVILPKFKLYAIANTEHDHLSSLEYVESKLDAQSLTDNSLDYGAISSSVCKDDLANCNIFTSRSHGTAIKDENESVLSTGILLNDPSLLDSGVCFFSHTFSDIPSTSAVIEASDTFNDLDLALFIACQTANGGDGGNNLPTKIVEHGASVAIGFTEDILCTEANKWTQAFYDYFLAGHSVQASSNYAQSAVTANSGLASVVIVGDSSLTIDDLLSN